MTGISPAVLLLYIIIIIVFIYCCKMLSFPSGSNGKESVCNAGDLGSFVGLGRSPGEGNGHPLQYSFLENSVDKEAWRAIVHGVTWGQT